MRVVIAILAAVAALAAAPGTASAQDPLDRMLCSAYQTIVAEQCPDYWLVPPPDLRH